MSFDVQHYWDNRYQNRAHYYPPEDGIAELLRDIHFDTVLDYGCGDGKLAMALFDADGYVGLDISEVGIDQAHLAGGGDWEFYVVPDGPLPEVDLVFTRVSLTCTSDEVIQETVARLLRCCKEALFVEIEIAGACDPHCFAHDYAELFGDRLIERTKVGPKTEHKWAYHVKGDRWDQPS